MELFPVFLVTSLQASLPHQLISPHLNFSSVLTTLNFVTLSPSGSMFSTAVAHYSSYCTVFRVSMSGSNFLLAFMVIHLYVGSFIHMNVPFLSYPFRYEHNGNNRNRHTRCCFVLNHWNSIWFWNSNLVDMRGTVARTKLREPEHNIKCSDCHFYLKKKFHSLRDTESCHIYFHPFNGVLLLLLLLSLFFF